MNKGYIHVYTGDGKGKTTAALGLALRAAGANMSTYIAQFMKLGEYSEIKAISKLSNFITIEQFGTGNFISKKPSKEDIKKAQNGLLSVKEKLLTKKFDLIIMDEANMAVSCGLLNIDDIINIINNKPEKTELIITGRNANYRIIEIADLVTEMKNIKHYYSKNIIARVGIEK